MNVFRLLLTCLLVFPLIPLHVVDAAEVDNYVPLRNVFESLGSKVIKDGNNIIIKRGKTVVTVKENSATAVKNGKEMALYQPILFLENEDRYGIHVLDVYKLAKRADKEKHYRVQPGDSLSEIAKRFGVTVEDLINWNGLTSQIIYPYQHLHTTNPYYTVQPGDSLWEIAKETESSVEAIKDANKLTIDFITSGQTLYIPIQPSMTAPAMFAQGVFPLVQDSYDAYGNDFDSTREHASDNEAYVHEGIDILAHQWVPVFSATTGKVIDLGWKENGGWRIIIETANGIAMYYAGLNGYPKGLKEGQTISRGQLIGYVGNTGNDTDEDMLSHLHFGMYDTNMSPWKPINPFFYLKWWEMNPNY